jgi:hypothetical protein
VGALTDILEIATPHGPAHAHLRPTDGARGGLVLGHGAGGGVDAPDLAELPWMTEGANRTVGSDAAGLINYLLIDAV